MQNIFILVVLFLTLLSLCQADSSTRVMVRSMDQLIAKLGRDISTKNPECAILFNDVCPIGCNGRIGDEALLLDRCGICGGDGSSCASDDDDGNCDATCIALVVGIPMGLLLLICLIGSIVFFSGAAARRRRRQEELAQQRRNTTSPTTNKHFSPPLRSHGNPVSIRGHVSPAPTYGRKHSTVAMLTKRKPKTKIRRTNGAPYGWGKGDKYY